MLRGWVHSGFNVHRSRRVLPEQREDIERLAHRRPGGHRAHPAPPRIVGTGRVRLPCQRALPLDPSSPVTYPSHHDIASSDRSQRASARTTRKAIFYQSWPIFTKDTRILNPLQFTPMFTAFQPSRPMQRGSARVKKNFIRPNFRGRTHD